MSTLQLKIPGYYIAKNKDGAEQIVDYDDTCYNPDSKETLYHGYYGVYGFHEVFTNINNIRELTNTEKEYLDKNEYWNLPQQFYQSFP